MGVDEKKAMAADGCGGGSATDEVAAMTPAMGGGDA